MTAQRLSQIHQPGTHLTRLATYLINDQPSQQASVLQGTQDALQSAAFYQLLWSNIQQLAGGLCFAELCEYSCHLSLGLL